MLPSVGAFRRAITRRRSGRARTGLFSERKQLSLRAGLVDIVTMVSIAVRNPYCAQARSLLVGLFNVMEQPETPLGSGRLLPQTWRAVQRANGRAAAGCLCIPGMSRSSPAGRSKTGISFADGCRIAAFKRAKICSRVDVAGWVRFPHVPQRCFGFTYF